MCLLACTLWQLLHLCCLSADLLCTEGKCTSKRLRMPGQVVPVHTSTHMHACLVQAPQQAHHRTGSNLPNKRLETTRGSLSIPRSQHAEVSQPPQPQPPQPQTWLPQQEPSRPLEPRPQWKQPCTDQGTASLSSSPDTKLLASQQQGLPVSSRQTSGGLLLPTEWQLPKYADVYLGQVR